jgi:prevent-host-death family protein
MGMFPMSMSLTEDFKTLDELRQDAEAILDQVRTTGRPISITREGKPAAVLLDVAAFERMLQTLNLVRLLGPAEEDLIAGRVTPLDEVMRELYRANEIPDSRRARGAARRSGNSRLHRPGQEKGGKQVGS